jgi:hypothetical protein
MPLWLPITWRDAAFLAMVPMVLLTVGCGADAEAGGETPQGFSADVRYGPAVEVDGGLVRSYVKEEAGRVVELGVAVDAGVLPALPDSHDPGGIVTPDGHSVFVSELALPENHGTPFDHATLDWIPAGHEPPGVYDVPHFDVHFYTIPPAERMAIVPTGPEFGEKAAHHPGPEYVPAGYVDPGMPPVPQMGVHWVDLSSPELRPEGAEPFTRTFIYGSWDGRIIFVEPMVALSWLETRPDETVPVATAERYDPSGLWPGAYRVYFDADTDQYRVALADLRER